MRRDIKVIILGAAAVLAAAGGWWAQKALGGAEPAPAAAKEQAIAAPAKTLYNCAMHPTYIKEEPGKCPFCGMDLTPMAPEAGTAGAAAPESAVAGGGRVRIDPSIVQNIGVRTEPVGRRELAAEIRANGRIAVDETRQFAVNARVAGWAERLEAAATGQAVKKGQPLLELYSPDLASTQEEYLQALRYARNLDLARTSGPPGAGGHSAEARRAASELLESARRRLLNFGFPEAGIQELASKGTAARTLTLPSPASGVVMEKMVIQGQKVEPGMPLYRIADLSRVWVLASLYQGDLARVKVGTPATISLSYLPGRSFSGKVAFISPVLDPESRTAEVRVEVANTPGLDLKPEMFASVTLRPASAGAVIAVPEQALIRSGKRTLAIVSLGDGYFEPREVRVGRTAEGWAEVLEGLAEGESLVVSSQFLIDSESNLKAAIRQMQSRTAAADSAPAGPSPGSAPPATGHGAHGQGGPAGAP